MKNLIEIIRSQNYTIKNFSKLMNISYPTIYNWNNFPKTITVIHNKELTRLLGIDYTLWINHNLK